MAVQFLTLAGNGGAMFSVLPTENYQPCKNLIGKTEI